MDAVRSMITRKRTNKKMILQEVSGVFKPGTITLVLGQPGSGKSALMKLLSGRFPKKQNITIEGEVTYNGTPASDVGNILPQLVSYVQQHDKHYPELTVKETLEFAHSACGGDVSPTDVSHFVNGSAQENAEAVEAAQVLSKNYTYVVIQQLGLENCQNTVVGDAMLRGVSRGERKRVTTGEMAFGNKYVMMMDEISTGLDSAATFDIITTQRSIAKEFRKTVVISLLQPSPEVFALFDNVMIMNAGRLIYHGLSKEVLNYFENIGFKCPPFCDVADFLLDLGTRNQFEYEVCEEDQIQEYLVWIYWLNPLSWSVRALVVNQYTDAQFDVCMYDGIDYCLMHNKTMGKFSLSSYEVPPEKYWIWYGMVYSAASDLWYTVPDPANPKETIALLKGISGYALPGTITALMGSSGAGKTTLMDVIAGRKTGGKIQGQILLNGHPATDLAIRRSTGYCEQMDIHSESSTIREALTFSAFLRQGADVPDSYKYASVDECLDLLGLNPIADQIIRGSSVEQMKRLTIGVELAAQPSVLFLDEPTSGLDARSAKLIMDGVRKVANTGRTIICTIHQPSAEVFRVFDSLLLLKRGGETVFAGELGENASEMIDYFESINGVTKLKDNYNPATWMLELIGAGTRTDFAKIYQLSTPCERWLATLENDGISLPSLTYNESQITIKRGAAQVVQLKFLMKRVWNLYWRTSSFNLTRFNFSQTLGLLLGFMYLDVEYASYTSINSGMGMLFVAMALLGLVAFDGMVSIAAVERTVFYRERSSHTYNMIWYIFATSVMELLYVFIDVLLFLVSLYPMVGFKGTSGFLNCWVIFSCYTLLQAYIAEFLVFLLPNTNLVNFFGIVVFSISFIFSGFSPPASSLPSSTKWLHDIVPMSYSLSAVATTVFGQCSGSGDIGCREMTNIPPTLAGGITVKEHLEVNFLMKDNEFSRNCGVLAAILLLVRVLTLLAMRICNYRT
ncbi:Pleiotropic drug resistance protein transporter [Phytophthora megakarya]|uniref:Pleiotropic drug resistance protein transporter n=1 Tax=Phytophthora megakarya TaxID=4795 RepID=A0A225WTK6_9STRA|nr:Pleiotropic drug resistance protein transporter [Phytophthora megakarya]